MAGYLDARPRVGYFYSGKTGSQLLGERVRKLQVKDFKSVPIVIQESSSVYDAICTMFLEDVGTLFVVNKENTLAGVVSRKDLLRASLGKQHLEDMPVSIIMTRMPNIMTCYMEDSLLDAAGKLINNQIDALPVVKEKEGSRKSYEVIGRITKTTITKAFYELGNDEPV